ncbi:MAG TPA: response regulator transcription factor [Acidimicrobiales bacterium]|nr:response regulator transcription factor [Acidimicrobiales bacterium]
MLLVDDEPDVRRMLAFFLESLGFRVIGEAGDGDRALELLGSLQPDAVILDLQMAGLDGFEALPRVRRLAPETRIVVYSGHIPPGVDELAAALGADAVVRKGSPLAEVEAALRG